MPLLRNTHTHTQHQQQEQNNLSQIAYLQGAYLFTLTLLLSLDGPGETSIFSSSQPI